MKYTHLKSAVLVVCIICLLYNWLFKQLIYSYDYLKITDDNNVTIGKYCGKQTGKEVHIGGDYAILTLHADNTEQRRGFRLSFTAVQSGKCNLNLI